MALDSFTQLECIEQSLLVTDRKTWGICMREKKGMVRGRVVPFSAPYDPATEMDILRPTKSDRNFKMQNSSVGL